MDGPVTARLHAILSIVHSLENELLDMLGAAKHVDGAAAKGALEAGDPAAPGASMQGPASGSPFDLTLLEEMERKRAETRKQLYAEVLRRSSLGDGVAAGGIRAGGMRHVGVCETSCTACEGRHWTTADLGVLLAGGMRCPNCGHPCLRPVLDECETIIIPLGPRVLATIRIPKHQCDHGSYALRALSMVARKMSEGGQL